MSGANRDVHVAFGPVMEGIGSWHWLGEDLAGEMGKNLHTSCWTHAPGNADVVVFVKYPPPVDLGTAPK